jgi:hypothetical protein
MFFLQILDAGSNTFKHLTDAYTLCNQNSAPQIVLNFVSFCLKSAQSEFLIIVNYLMQYKILPSCQIFIFFK